MHPTDSFTVRELLGYHDGVIFYDTLSVCAVCTVVTRKGIVWCPAVVRQDGRDVYLRTTCEIHGMCQSIYSRNAKLFRRLIFPDIVASASQRAMSNRFTSLSEVRRLCRPRLFGLDRKFIDNRVLIGHVTGCRDSSASAVIQRCH